KYSVRRVGLGARNLFRSGGGRTEVRAPVGLRRCRSEASVPYRRLCVSESTVDSHFGVRARQEITFTINKVFPQANSGQSPGSSGDVDWLASSFPSFPSVGLFEDKPLVFDFDNALVDSRQLVEAQFAEEALLINAFDQAGSLEAMDLDGGADDRVAQFICFVEQWMHKLILQKQTKETKEEPKPSSSSSG